MKITVQQLKQMIKEAVEENESTFEAKQIINGSLKADVYLDREDEDVVIVAHDYEPRISLSKEQCRELAKAFSILGT
jgi:hypothetical protein